MTSVVVEMELRLTTFEFMTSDILIFLASKGACFGKIGIPLIEIVF